MELELFNKIAQKSGHVASWAVWTPAGDRPKSNIGDMKVFDLQTNPDLLNTLKTDVIMVGLNFSREVKSEQPFKNFHDPNPRGNDYKIRYAFTNTPFYGAYMTDVIKNLPMVSSKEVLKYLKDKSEILDENIKSFCEELTFIKAEKPLILAFGKDVYSILKKKLAPDYYSSLIKLPHYSHQIGQIDYKREVFKQLEEQLGIIISNTQFDIVG